MASPTSPVIERFSASAGRTMGLFTLAVLAVAAVLVVVDGGVVGRLGVLFWLAAGALACWIALVRPAVQARADHLLLRNLLRDTEVPWHLVDQARVAQTLRIRVDERVYHGVAIGRSARSDLRAQRQVSRGSSSASSGASAPPDPVVAPDYTDYVVDRIVRLAKEGSEASAHRPAVTHRWAKFELASILALALLGAALRLT